MKMKKFFLVLTSVIALGNTAFSESSINDKKELLEIISTTKVPQIVSGYKSAKEGVNTLFTYSENSMYTIYARPNYLTSIMLQPGEEILFVGGGDTARWRRAEAVTGSEDGERVVIYIKPSSINLRTNLVINTNKRSYQINLISDKALYNPLVRWQYPQDQLIQQIAKENKIKKLNETQEKIIDPAQLNYNYVLNTDRYEFAPQQVFDDGVKTYILLKSDIQEMPTFYIRDGKELFLVNYRTKGNLLIVDRTFTVGELRVGNKKILIKKK